FFMRRYQWEGHGIIEGRSACIRHVHTIILSDNRTLIFKCEEQKCQIQTVKRSKRCSTKGWKHAAKFWARNTWMVPWPRPMTSCWHSSALPPNGAGATRGTARGWTAKFAAC